MHWQGMSAFPTLAKVITSVQKPDYLLQGYPEYCTSPRDLDPAQQRLLKSVADEICHSLASMFPVRGVVIVGHADRALRKAASERASFEQGVSDRRASSAKDILVKQLQASAGCEEVKYIVQFRAVGMGSRKLAVVNPVNEAEMRKNRRVEIYLLRKAVSKPSCNCGC